MTTAKQQTTAQDTLVVYHIRNIGMQQLDTVEDVYNRIKELERENARLVCAERERDIALGAVEGMRQQIDMISNELDYTRLQLNRALADKQELEDLRKWKASVKAVAAVHHEQLGPYEKLALIIGTTQVPYSAELHGGESNVMLTSMGQWNNGICGVNDNTNTINRALVRLEASETVIRTKIDTGDGKTHWNVQFNENHLQHPRFINPGEPRKHNGGDKRCPQCHKFCKKKLGITYVCEPCGIDYDVHMKPIDHNAPRSPEPETTEKPVEQSEPAHQPALTLVPTGECPTCHEVNWSESGECITCWVYGGGK